MIRHRFSDRLLHRLALQSRSFRKFCFTRECERNPGDSDRHRQHLFITGLARSGSTALLNRLHASDAFAATTYELMPFVLAPSLARVVGRFTPAATGPVERRHGDSLSISPQSAEALDGIFWNTYLPSTNNPQRPRDVPQPVLERYTRFIENILRHHGKTRYLSKMNQGIALLPALVPWYDRSLFLVPFREPLQQAASLLRQHQRFATLDGYETDYLDWLEHHEFGATHRAFEPDSSAASTRYSPAHLAYWLDQWRRGYGFLAQLADSEARLVPLAYERLASSDTTWQQLSQRLDVALDGGSFRNCNDAELEARDVDPALLDDCQALYQRLDAQGEKLAC